MPLPNLASLPETIKPELLRSLFAQAISANIPDIEKVKVMFELSDKQWHCYERLSPDIASSVSSWIEHVWNVNDFEITEQLIGIIGSLGLDEEMHLLQRSVADNAIPLNTRKMLQEAIEEFGPRPIDPYKGMSL